MLVVIVIVIILVIVIVIISVDTNISINLLSVSFITELFSHTILINNPIVFFSKLIIVIF